MFRIEFEDKGDSVTYKPKIPKYLHFKSEKEKQRHIHYANKYNVFEDYKTKRVCFSPTIQGCLNAILTKPKTSTARERFVSDNLPKTVYLYKTEKPINKYEHKSDKDIVKEGLVFDAFFTKENWILEPVKIVKIGTVTVSGIEEIKRHYTYKNIHFISEVKWKFKKERI